MPGLFSRFDWRKSWAHREMLSRFIHPRESTYFSNDYWSQVLKESPDKAIKRFVDKGLLEPAGVPAILDYRLKGSDLKRLLKERGLKVSGRKAELAKRFADADPEEAARLTADVRVFQCTDEGKEMAQEHLSLEDAERALAEESTLSALKEMDFKKASRVVADFEAKREPEPRNISDDVGMLTSMFETTPEILSAVPSDALEQLRIAAGMMYLWGERRTKGWIKPDLQTGLRMDNDTAARMFYFRANYIRQIRDWRESGVVEKVEILGSSDSCEACREIAGKKFRIEEAPVLPYAKCTHEMGCRCDVVPVVDI